MARVLTLRALAVLLPVLLLVLSLPIARVFVLRVLLVLLPALRVLSPVLLLVPMARVLALRILPVLLPALRVVLLGVLVSRMLLLRLLLRLLLTRRVFPLVMSVCCWNTIRPCYNNYNCKDISTC
jgi:hypothetical protein